MNTLIEILDYEQTENIISPLVFDFQRIIYLYDEHHDTLHKRKTLAELLKKKGIADVQFQQVSLPAEPAFESLVQQYPEAVFNLSNGSRSLLVQMAAFCEKTQQKCYTLNFQRKSFQNIRGCDSLKKQFHVPKLSIEDMILLSSGEIIKTSHQLPQMNETMRQDMMNVIAIMNADSSAWTRLLSVFAKEMKEAHDCELWMNVPTEKRQMDLLNQLEKGNLLHCVQHGQRLRLVFKNRTWMKLLSDSGAWLEYQSYLECAQSGDFDDVRISTVVDWNKLSSNPNDPTCEVDLIVVKNCIPVFVSCKMNKCTSLDLYEIRLLAQKLGGTLGKAAVISKAQSLQDNEPLCLKAEELGIALIREKEIEHNQIAESLLKLIG